MRGTLAVVALALLGGVGCQSPTRYGPAQLTVEVQRGFVSPTAPLGELPVRLALVVDTRSRVSAERAAVFVRALPEASALSVRVIGGASGCGPGSDWSGRDREQLRLLLTGRSGGEEGSLGAALGRVADELLPVADRESARVVVFTDRLEDSCADLCAVAARLAAGGAWLDWVVPAAAQAPACLLGARPTLEGPGPLVTRLTAPAPTFQVRLGPTPDGDALAAGRAGDTVPVAPGDVTVWLDLQPPESVGPFRVAPGEALRLRVLDFPLAEPPMRRWQLQRRGSGLR